MYPPPNRCGVVPSLLVAALALLSGRLPASEVPTLYWSIDVGSDEEMSDPRTPGLLDPGDVFKTAPGTATVRLHDDEVFFGVDPPPAPALPIGDLEGRLAVTKAFDLDGIDTLGEAFYQIDGPIARPPRCRGLEVNPKQIFYSLDDDGAHGWYGSRSSQIGDVPANAAPDRGEDDEIVTAVGWGSWTPTPGRPAAGEADLGLGKPPTLSRLLDDDVDALDTGGHRFIYWSCDHEATRGLDPADIYLSDPRGEIVPAGERRLAVSHRLLGLADGTDVDAFEFAIADDAAISGHFDLGPGPWLAVLFSVDDDDPATEADESGGLDPRTIYVSLLTGASRSLSRREADVDALAVLEAAVEAFDRGDAPDDAASPGYPTLQAHDGARHRLDLEQCLGWSVDAEPDGQPDAAAAGDDRASYDPPAGDDEDGVTFASALVVGQPATLEVVASGIGEIDAWVDFGRDGGWSEPGDQVFRRQRLSRGINSLSFPVPSSAALGETYARFRYAKTGGLAPGGEATSGEVEDYRIVIEALDWGDAPDAPEDLKVHRIVGSEVEAGDRFGGGDISGDWALLRAPGDDEGAENAGRVYVFHWDGSSWVQTQKIENPDPERWTGFGGTISMDGDWAMLRAPASASRRDDPGSVLAYQRRGAVWESTQTLNVPGRAGDDFGHGLRVLGDEAIILRWASEEGGLVYVFHRVGAVWVEEERLHVPNPGGIGRDGEWLAVGSARDAGGVVVFFRREGGRWVERQELFPSDGRPNDMFGSGIRLAGRSAYVSAWQRGVGSVIQAGGLYVLELEGDRWIERQFLTASDAIDYDCLATGIGLLGDLLLLGTARKDLHGPDSGAVYFFRWDGEIWTEGRPMAPLDVGPGSYFGSAIRVSGNRVLLSAAGDPHAGYESGAAYIIHLERPARRYPTLFVNDGARHSYSPGVFLGRKLDFDSNGRPSAGADGDDLHGDDDEDGVRFTSPLRPGGTATVEVQASAGGALSAWVDFNDDGDWNDPGEKIFSGTLLAAGLNRLSFGVPQKAVPTTGKDPTVARFRFSTRRVQSHHGPAPDGEVEDLPVLIEQPDPTRRFLRCDANVDGAADVSDAIFALGYLFLGGEKSPCEKASDMNDDGKVDLSDSVFLLGYLFLGGKPPNEPLGACGWDPTPDDLTCQSFAACP